MYAIVEINGQQFKVEQGKKLFVNHINDAEAGNTVEFDKVLLVDNDGTVTVGAPNVEGAKVQYVTTSGLIVHPDFQGLGIAKRIKDYTFTLARVRWPHAKIFSLTSGDAVMKMNTELGYVPVSFNQLTDDEAFWRGCRG